MREHATRSRRPCSRPGGKINVIPASASATLDVRVVPGQAEAVREQLAAVVGDDIEVTWARDIPAIEAPAEGRLIDVLQDAVTAEDPDGSSGLGRLEEDDDLDADDDDDDLSGGSRSRGRGDDYDSDY